MAHETRVLALGEEETLPARQKFMMEVDGAGWTAICSCGWLANNPLPDQESARASAYEHESASEGVPDPGLGLRDVDAEALSLAEEDQVLRLPFLATKTELGGVSA